MSKGNKLRELISRWAKKLGVKLRRSQPAAPGFYVPKSHSIYVRHPLAALHELGHAEQYVTKYPPTRLLKIFSPLAAVSTTASALLPLIARSTPLGKYGTLIASALAALSTAVRNRLVWKLETDAWNRAVKQAKTIAKHVDMKELAKLRKGALESYKLMGSPLMAVAPLSYAVIPWLFEKGTAAGLAGYLIPSTLTSLAAAHALSKTDTEAYLSTLKKLLGA